MFRSMLIFLLITVLIVGCTPSDNPNISSPEPTPDDVTINVTMDPEVLPAGSPDAISTITASLTDAAGNPLAAGHTVTFSTNLGSIEHTALTNPQGQAIVFYTPGSEPGEALITARFDTHKGPVQGGGTVCVVDPAKPVYIEITTSHSEIMVMGTGGNSTALLTATVRNGIGEVVTEEVEITFELINEPEPPAGAILNGNDQREVIETVNGVAIVGLNAGEQIGGKLVRASLVHNNETIEAIANNVSVISGPVFQMDVDVNDRGYDAGGGAWIIEVSARVWDIHRNPVQDGISVVFTIEPEVATIGTGWTGNENREGKSTAGLAFAELVYHSMNTFDEIEIHAESQAPRGQIQWSREHVLPLQKGQISLNVDPMNWMFDEDHEQADIRCWAVIKDGHGILINNAPVLFSCSRSSFWWKDFSNDRFIEYFPDPARKFSGVVDRQNNERPGQATVYLRASVEDIFLDPFTLESSVQINAQVEGYDNLMAEPKFIYFNRSAG